MRKTNHLMMVGAALLALAVMPSTALAAPFEVGSTGTRGWGIDFNPATGKTVYVFPGRKQIIADPVTNTKTVTRRNGTVVTKDYPGWRKGAGGPSMGLARFFYSRSL
ncbi:MAG: hypothetical protein WA914_03985 [Candidatus Macondimonas sp.]|jgi:hypothetical protein